jgi:hypothetical protein
MMNNEQQENGALRGALILLVPASNLVAVMSLDWLDDTNRAALSTKTHGWNYLANPMRSEFSRARPAVFVGGMLD